MFLSLIIVAQNHPVKLMRTLLSIKEQTDIDFEVILIDDSGFQPKSTVLEFLSEHFYSVDKRIKIITNLRSQGFSYCWNAAIKVASGKYLIFLDEGEKPAPKFVEILKENITKYGKEQKEIDIVEFGLHYPHSKSNSAIRNKYNIVLSPKTHKEVLAYTHCLIYTKMFRRQFILKKEIEFTNYVRYDALFIYKTLAFASSFLAINDILGDYELGIVKYSVFDLLKQWVHIFNFYRELNLYREYHSELEYAFVRFCLVTFLRIVRLQNNKTLGIKAIISAENKIDHRAKSFKTNRYSENIAEEKFKVIVDDIKNYIKNWKIDNSR